MDPVNECYKFISSCDEPATFDLITAASVGDVRLVQKFLRKSVNPNTTNAAGWTSLMYAANYGHYNVVRVLIESGADADIQEWTSGKTALMFAASNGHTRCVEVLVNHGRALIDQADYSGRTAAYFATHFGHGNNKIIGKLLKIVDTRKQPRRITKALTPRPQIVITEADGNTFSEKHRTPLQFGAQTTPVLPFYHFANIKDSVETNSPRGEYTNGHESNGYTNDVTPVMHISSDLAIRRKRRLLTDAGSEEAQQIGSASKSGSPPLPDSLDELLIRLNLEEYISFFADSSVDLYVFLTLTDKDLKELGILSIGHRRRLTAAQQRFRESIEIRNAQEKFFADWLLNEREQMKLELEALRTANSELTFQLQDLQSKKE